MVVKPSRKQSIAMISLALRHLATQLNQFLKRTLDLSEDVVVLSNLLEQNGDLAPNVKNKVVLFITNIEREVAPVRLPSGGNSGFRIATSSPTLHLNLYVMMVANFTGNNYPEGLKFISAAIAYFQRQPVFDRQNSPDLDSRIDKLILEIENLKLQDLSNVWGQMNGKYLPSILYKVRMLSFASDDVIDQIPVITGREVSAER